MRRPIQALNTIMITHRIQGMASLHRSILVLASGASFWVHIIVLNASGRITFHSGFSPWGYFLALLLGTLWACRLVSDQHPGGPRSRFQTFRLSLQQLLRVSVLLLALAFSTRDLTISRSFLLSMIAGMGVLFFVINSTVPALLCRLFFRTAPMRTVLCASKQDAQKLCSWIGTHGELGIEIMGFVADTAPLSPSSTLRYLGPRSGLGALLREHIIDQVLADQRLFSPQETQTLSTLCEHTGTRARFYLHVDSCFSLRTGSPEHCGAYSFASATAEPLEHPINRIVKRMLDLAIAIPVALFVLPPIALITALMQRLQSPGPLMYRQQRTGMNRRTFKIYKFRTMHSNSTAAKQATHADSRIYQFGRFLRKTSLDELPQVLNVLHGEMSINGPRPHLIDHDDLFSQQVATYKVRHFVKPGITGLAQCKGLRGEITEHRALLNRVRYDMLYVAKWSLSLDLKIIVKTALQVIHPPRSAY